ncbi:DegT/DnrJ/EryC1/StrS family aminotransferase [Mucilaginibacter terrigena]|nr:DegT/DnrJ/EryC1/StrS family aminotransferase [Mucilaginibacter terrigena]
MSADKADRQNRETNDGLICLSVRTGLHLVLSALNYPPGSEILVTNINIPDMFNILDAHGLKSVPLALNKNTLGINAEEMENAITPNTRAILITHLFGAIMDTGKIVALAKKHNLTVIEDCAQAFTGDAYRGNPLSDVVMFSFGLIKTNTTLTGALLKFNNNWIYKKAITFNSTLPVQLTGIFAKKLRKALIIKLLTTNVVYTLFYKFCMAGGRDFDDVLAGFTKGFPGAEVMEKIRFRPCAGNIGLIKYRLESFNSGNIEKRRNNALQILQHLPRSVKIGSLNNYNSHWVLPVETANPAKLIAYLRANGFDATQRASSLVKITGGETNSPDELKLESLVYIPVQSLNKSGINKLGVLLKQFFAR